MTETVYQDEISLRELYLILRRNLWLIALVTVLVGAATFLFLQAQPPSFEAEATTLVTPPPIQVQSPENISFRPGGEVSFEAYETLARSRPVVEAALAAVPEAGVSYRDFGGSVNMLIGPQQATQSGPLAVTHRVRHRDAGLAARLSNAWAEAALEAVQTSLLASLEPISERTAAEIEALRADLQASEESLRAFRVSDQGETLSTLLTAVNERLANLEREQALLEQQLAADRAGVELLLSSEAAPGAALDAESLATALEVLQSQQALASPATEDQEAATRLGKLAALLRSLPDDTLEGSLTRLLNQADLRERLVGIAANEAALEQLAEQRRTFEVQASDLQARIAELEAERIQLEREQLLAESAYTDVVTLQPIINYVRQITPANARMLNEATVPEAPVAPRPLLGTAIALLVAALLSTLFVFLREAVRPPAEAPLKAPSVTPPGPL